jgi:hypothetical protein
LGLVHPAPLREWQRLIHSIGRFILECLMICEFSEAK